MGASRGGRWARPSIVPRFAPPLRRGLDLVPEVGALGRVLHELEPDHRVFVAGAGERRDGVAEAGALRELLADLLLQHEVDPGFGQLLLSHAASERPGVEPGDGALL